MRVLGIDGFLGSQIYYEWYNFIIGDYIGFARVGRIIMTWDCMIIYFIIVHLHVN